MELNMDKVDTSITLFKHLIRDVTAAYMTIMYRLEVIVSRLSRPPSGKWVWGIDDIVRIRRTGDST
jgi:hypothetical protein